MNSLYLLVDLFVEKDNRNKFVLDLKNRMMLHPNRIDMVHQLKKNDWQKNFDQMLKKMDHNLLLNFLLEVEEEVVV